jgi:mannose-6-phosphate isomerase
VNIIEKPWGQEEILEINKKYMVKKLTMWRGHRCSLQFHKNKIETIFVLSGALKISYGESQVTLKERIFYAGENFTIFPGLIHRMEGVTESTYLEASTPEIDDVIRLADDYKR